MDLFDLGVHLSFLLGPVGSCLVSSLQHGFSVTSRKRLIQFVLYVFDFFRNVGWIGGSYWLLLSWLYFRGRGGLGLVCGWSISIHVSICIGWPLFLLFH